MLNIGIIGIGHIAQKVYLPYMRQLQGICWHLSTRNASIRQEVSESFGQAEVYNSVNDLAEVDLDGVFIHAATSVHAEIASLFLKKGIPVYMDKPVTESFASTFELYQLAQKHQTFLMTGFNRRFAPRVKELSTVSNARTIRVEKNDINRPGPLTAKLFDFFIHPLDTALFLSKEPLIRGHFDYHQEDGLLSHVRVFLVTESTSLSVSMNLQSGSRREVMEIQTPEVTYELENLDSLYLYRGNQQEQVSFGSWDTTLYKRGFETIIDAFLEAVKNGVNPVNPTSSLLSHWICEQINSSQQPYGELTFDWFEPKE
ncbi:Gfo/Idh/MocA family protein [Streptococcus phocae]|uniref:Oxidoreductase n=1 Tax=Streptococcus phocae TaxID=119224 RepID=A0A0P6S369_9STRE|nr:Gfo/Idh/MocA family oxidoreductase [Streptococcus phocae]KPJ23062.1 oxidoreductase [Streptococcus phocae]